MIYHMTIDQTNAQGTWHLACGNFGTSEAAWADAEKLEKRFASAGMKVPKCRVWYRDKECKRPGKKGVGE